jgi:hypothetical protein
METETTISALVFFTSFALDLLLRLSFSLLFWVLVPFHFGSFALHLFIHHHITVLTSNPISIPVLPYVFLVTPHCHTFDS